MTAPPDTPGGDAGASLIRPFVSRSAAMATSDGAREAASRSDTVVRPFLVTSGRTESETDIPMEAQVVVTPEGRGARQWLAFEYRDIVGLCDEPLAVAEIAARLRLHLGVARVLVGDLQERGIVTTYCPEADTDVDTIMRVINGLRLRN